MLLFMLLYSCFLLLPFLSFLGFFLLSMSFIIHFSLSFHILLFYNFFTLISYVDYYIQFHFLTCSSMTSPSFFNSLNSHFFIFFIPFWFSNCYSSPLLTHFSHPFHIFVFYKLLSLLPCVDCYIQFSYSTSYNMTSSSFSNSFNCPFLFFYDLFWYHNCYTSLLLTHFSHPFHIFVFYKLLSLLLYVDCYIQFSYSTSYNMTSSSFFNSFNCPFFIFLCLVLVFKLLFISLAYSL